MAVAGRISEIEVFVKVVETGSFTAAADALHLSPSAVSKIIARIEARLGLPLAVRSTRKLRLTAEGEDYFARGKQILKDISSLERGVKESAGQVGGVLRVSCNVPFGLHCVTPLVPGFLEAYPEISLEFSLSDSTTDLIGDGIDVAIRTGVLTDSTIHARRIVASPRRVVASPAYLDKHGVPAEPRDLLKHNCLTLGFSRSYGKWPFRIEHDGIPTQLDLAVKGNLSLDNGEGLRRFALDGVGLARLSEFHVGRDLKEGRLVAVLDTFNPGDREPVSIIYADQSPLAPRIRAFIDYLARFLVT
ncbi:LysR family transcriptional regulator [Rhizobium giardinii]|uniref:LysR family transcriptional regulator n=1 Tax=Rhizobium giardinii TaxID=56731 RepID=UPI001AEEB904|nr:LysR family transcriptional regulator [Rhizobium giardinii]